MALELQRYLTMLSIFLTRWRYGFLSLGSESRVLRPLVDYEVIVVIVVLRVLSVIDYDILHPLCATAVNPETAITAHNNC